MQTINNYSKKFSSVNNIGNFISKIIFYVCIVFFFHKSFIILEIRRNINYNSITNFGDNSKEYIIDENLYWNNQTSLNIDNIIKEIKYFNKEIYFERKTDFEKREKPKISIVINNIDTNDNLSLEYKTNLEGKKGFTNLYLPCTIDFYITMSVNAIKPTIDKLLMKIRNYARNF